MSAINASILNNANQLPRDDTCVSQMFINQWYRRKQKSYKVRLDKGALDLSIVDLAFTVYDEARARTTLQTAVRSKDDTSHIEFPVNLWKEKD